MATVAERTAGVTRGVSRGVARGRFAPITQRRAVAKQKRAVEAENQRIKKIQKLQQNIKSLEGELNKWAKEKGSIEREYINVSRNYNRQLQVYLDDKQRMLSAIPRKEMSPREIKEMVASIEREFEVRMQPYKTPLDKIIKKRKVIDKTGQELKSKLYSDIDTLYKTSRADISEAENLKKGYESSINSIIASETAQERQRQELLDIRASQRYAEKERQKSISAGEKPKGWEQWTESQQKGWIATGTKPSPTTRIYGPRGKLIEEKFDYVQAIKEKGGKKTLLEMPRYKAIAEGLKIQKKYPTVKAKAKASTTAELVGMMTLGGVYKAQAIKELKARGEKIPDIKITKAGPVIIPEGYKELPKSAQQSIDKLNKKAGENIQPERFIEDKLKITGAYGDDYELGQREAERYFRENKMIKSNEYVIPTFYYDKKGNVVYSYGVITKGGVSKRLLNDLSKLQQALVTPTIALAQAPSIIKSMKEGISELGKEYFYAEPTVEPIGGGLVIKLSPKDFTGLPFVEFTKSDKPLVTAEERISNLYKTPEMVMEKIETEKLAKDWQTSLATGVHQFGGIGTALETASLFLQTGRLISPKAVWEQQKFEEAGLVRGISLSRKPIAKIDWTTPETLQKSLKGTKTLDIYKYAGTRGLEGGLLASTIIVPRIGMKGNIPVEFIKRGPFKGMSIGEVGGKTLEYGFKGMVGAQAYQTYKMPTAENIASLLSFGLFAGGFKIGRKTKSLFRIQQEYAKGITSPKVKELLEMKAIKEGLKVSKFELLKKSLLGEVKIPIEKKYTKYIKKGFGKEPDMLEIGKTHLIIEQKIPSPSGKYELLVIKGRDITYVIEKSTGKIFQVDAKFGLLAKNINITRPKRISWHEKDIIIEPKKTNIAKITEEMRSYGLTDKEIFEFLKSEGFTEGFNKTEYLKVVGEYQVSEPYTQFVKEYYKPETYSEYVRLKKLKKELKRRSVFGRISMKDIGELGALHNVGSIVFKGKEPLGKISDFGKHWSLDIIQKNKQIKTASPMEQAIKLKEEGKLNFHILSEKTYLKLYEEIWNKKSTPSVGVHFKYGKEGIPTIWIRESFHGKKIPLKELELTIAHELMHYKTIPKIPEKLLDINYNIPYKKRPTELLARAGEKLELVRQLRLERNKPVIKYTETPTKIFTRFKKIKFETEPSASIGAEALQIPEIIIREIYTPLDWELTSATIGKVPSRFAVGKGELSISTLQKAKAGTAKTTGFSLSKDIKTEEAITGTDYALAISKGITSLKTGKIISTGLKEITIESEIPEMHKNIGRRYIREKITKEKYNIPNELNINIEEFTGKTPKVYEELKQKKEETHVREQKGVQKVVFDKPTYDISQYDKRVGGGMQQMQLQKSANQELQLQNVVPSYGITSLKGISEIQVNTRPSIIIPLSQLRTKTNIQRQIKLQKNIKSQKLVKTNKKLQLQPQVNLQKQVNFNKQINLQPQIQIQPLEQIKREKQLQKQVKRQKQEYKKIQKPMKMRLRKQIIRPPIKPKVAIPFKTSIKHKYPAKREKAFKVELKRFGKWITVGKGLAEAEALSLGRTKAKTTLGATFRIVPMKGIAKPTKKKKEEELSLLKEEFRTYKIKKGKKVPLKNTFIQLKEMRLGTKPERREIQKSRLNIFSKKRKGGLLSWQL